MPLVKTPPRYAVHDLSEPASSLISLLLYGPVGSGKTYALMELLDLGYKMFVLDTDFGKPGHLTITLELQRRGRAELLKNYRYIVLGNIEDAAHSYEDIYSFVKEPSKFVLDFYDWDFDILVWEGFSRFQQVILGEYIGGMEPLGQKATEQRSSGLFFEQSDWQGIRNGTIRPLDHFLALSNRKTGKGWHKIVTCHEGYQNKREPGGSGIIESRKPLLQGSGGLIAGAGFDLIIRTMLPKRAAAAEEKWFYSIKPGEDSATKSRGFHLQPVEEASMGSLWRRLMDQLGVSRDKT